jgi:hypothetical protein
MCQVSDSAGSQRDNHTIRQCALLPSFDKPIFDFSEVMYRRHANAQLTSFHGEISRRYFARPPRRLTSTKNLSHRQSIRILQTCR